MNVTQHRDTLKALRSQKDKQVLSSISRLYKNEDAWEAFGAMINDDQEKAKSSASTAMLTFSDSFSAQNATPLACKTEGNRFLIAAQKASADGDEGQLQSVAMTALYCYYFGQQKLEAAHPKWLTLSTSGGNDSSARLAAILHVNAATCHELLGQYETALQMAELAVASDRSYVKGYFRVITIVQHLPPYKDELKLDKEYLELAIARASATTDAGFMSSAAVSLLMKEKAEQSAKMKSSYSAEDDAKMEAMRRKMGGGSGGGADVMSTMTPNAGLSNTDKAKAKEKMDLYLASLKKDSQENDGVWPTQQEGNVQCVLVKGGTTNGLVSNPPSLTALETVFLPLDDLITQQHFKSPAMEHIGLPLCVAPCGTATSSSTSNASFIAGLFLMDREKCTLPSSALELGDVVVFRTDGKPVAKGHVVGLWDYFTTTLDEFHQREKDQQQQQEGRSEAGADPNASEKEVVPLVLDKNQFLDWQFSYNNWQEQRWSMGDGGAAIMDLLDDDREGLDEVLEE